MRLTARFAPLAVVILALTACGDSAPPPAATQPAQRAPATPAAQPIQETIKQEESAERLVERANEALADDRLFDPAGDNALEFYLDAIQRAEAASAESEGDDKRSRRLSDSMNSSNLISQTKMAINDILPYGLVWVERAIRVNQYDEAQRVLGLLERAELGAASLNRLREQLTQAQTQSEREVAQAEQRAAAQQAAAEAAARAAAQAPATPPPAEPAPTQPVAQTPSSSATSQPVPQAPPPAQQPATAQPTPAQTQQTTSPAPASTPPAASAPTTTASPPRLISQPTMRYPTRALRQQVEGYVRVSFSIMPDGSTGKVTVIRGEPRGVFDREAIRLVEGLKFTPPGREITSERQIDFRLDQ